MRKYSKFIVAATAIAALAVPAVVPAVSAAAPPPTPQLYGDHSEAVIAGNIDVPQGHTLRLFGSEVTGNITVEGDLVMDGATADGNVNVNGGHFSSIAWGFLIKGGLSITNTPFDYNSNISGFWNTYGPGEIDGGLTYTHNNGQHLETGQGASVTVHGKFTYSDNSVPYTGGLTVLGQSNIS
jgi:hypothetical protein